MFLVLFLIIFLLIGYTLTSTLGIFISLIFASAGYFLGKKFIATDELSEDYDHGFQDFVKFTLASIFGGMVFLTTPLWDEKGYCEHQVDSYKVNQTRTLEDIFNGKQRTKTYFSDDTKECLELGGWNYVGGWDTAENWRVVPLYFIFFVSALIVGVFIWGFASIYLDEKKYSAAYDPIQEKKDKEQIERMLLSKQIKGIDWWRKNPDKQMYTNFRQLTLLYIKYYPEFNSKLEPNELKKTLNWAISALETVYAKNNTTAKNRKIAFTKLLEKLNKKIIATDKKKQ
jgi:hypothetical protein